MSKWHSIILGILFMVAAAVSPAFATLPQIGNGLSYLSSNQGSDGTWSTGTPLVETTAATISVLETLKLLNQTDGSSYTAGIAWLQAQSPQAVEYIAERLRTLSIGDVSTLVPAADTVKGGWGGAVGYGTNNLDTIVALLTYKGAAAANATLIYTNLAYMTGGQNADGGWGFNRGDDSNVYMTAVVSAILQQFPQMTSIATAVNKATSYLTSHQNMDGGYGLSSSTVHETALAYIALAAVSTDNTALGGAVTYLTVNQAPNGSWNDDPYATALALRALRLYEQKPPPPPPPAAGGRIKGVVLDASTSQRLNGVAVVLDSNPLINAYSDAFGNFTLNDVPVGDQKVNFTFKDYKPYTATASVTEGSVVNLGNVAMISSYSTGSIAGTIFDASGHPLPGVAIAVTGKWSGSGVTGPDGTFLFTYVTPGEVTITATKAGYQPVTATGTVFARTTLAIYPRMTTTPSSLTTGRLIGRVIDDLWGVPIDHLPEEQGVRVTISGGQWTDPDPNNGGNFSFEGLAPNTYQVTVGMNGFGSQTFRVIIMPGVTTDLGTIRLSWSFAMTLVGKVTDATTGTPITGAEVAVMGTNLAARTDFAGSYVIPNIDYPEITLKTSATGYKAKSITIGTAPWTQTMDISLSPLITTGSLSGTVYDVSTNLPLAGVSLMLVSDPAVTTTTDSGGAFKFNAIPKDGQEVRLSLSGYVQRTFTTKILAGTENKVGRIGLAAYQLPATVQGVVWDAVANAPFAGVDMQVTGTSLLQAFTAADGSYQFSYVTPGTVTVAATGGPKPGYFGAKFTGNLSPGGLMIFSPALSQTPPPGTLKGSVTDLADSQPIQGAAITLSPATAGVDPAFTDSTGTFTLSGIPVGKYTVSISAPGYTSQSTSVDIISGYLGETTIGVQLEKVGVSTTIAGKITDSKTGLPIPDAAVSIPGTTLSTMTAPDGTYTIGGIKALEFRVQASVAGYDSIDYGIKTGSYASYSVNLTMAKIGINSTRVFGVVRDGATGTPIAGAEVSILGLDKSAITAIDGTYAITGVTQLAINLKASAAGYDSKYEPLTASAYGEYEVSFALGTSRASMIVIKSVTTDKASYNANEQVNVTAEIENIGDIAMRLTVGGQVVDANGKVLGLLTYADNPANIDPHTTQTINLQWDTGQNPPGPHTIALSLVDYTMGGLLSESRASIDILPTTVVEGLVSLISPKFVNIATTNTVGVTAYLTNRSNADVNLSAQYEVKAPDGSLLNGGTVEFLLATGETSKTLSLTEFTHTFAKSGQYPVSVKIMSGGVPVAQTSDAIFVAPYIRIAPTENLVPATVVPDGDKDIRINIQIKGVEGIQ